MKCHKEITDDANIKITVLSPPPRDALYIIFSFLPDSSLFCSARLVCKEWNESCNHPNFWKFRTFDTWPSLHLIKTFAEKPWSSHNETEEQFWKTFYIYKKKPKIEINKILNLLPKVCEYNKSCQCIDKLRFNERFFSLGYSTFTWSEEDGVFLDEMESPGFPDPLKFIADSVIYEKVEKYMDPKCEKNIYTIVGKMINLKGKQIPFCSSNFPRRYMYGLAIDLSFTLKIGDREFDCFGPNDIIISDSSLDSLRMELGLECYENWISDLFKFIKLIFIPKEFHPFFDYM